MAEGIRGQEELGNTRAEGQVGAEGQSRPGRRRRRAPGRQKRLGAPPFWSPPTPPGGQDAVQHPRRWLRWDHGGAARASSRAPARPPPTPRPPAPCLPRPSPSSSRWMMLSMFSLSISAIASQRPGGPLPAAPLPPLAAWPARLLSSFCLVFPLPPLLPALLLPSLSSPPAPPLDRRSQQTPSTEQNGRRLLSELGRRTDTTSARRLTGSPL